jgi:hypothetical protein
MMIGKLPTVVALALPALIMIAAGCGPTDKPGSGPAMETPKAEKEEGHGWWCREHGILEAECAQCNADLATKLKEKGDWCEKHDRPESQCFVCNPKLKEDFAKKYQAKYGKEPPPIDEDKK